MLAARALAGLQVQVLILWGAAWRIRVALSLKMHFVCLGLVSWGCEMGKGEMSVPCMGSSFPQGLWLL